MDFPSEKTLKKMRGLLEKKEPIEGLPEDATNVQLLKHQICKDFSAYILEYRITHVEFAKRIEATQPQASNITRYKIDSFTLDKLLEFRERLFGKNYFLRKKLLKKATQPLDLF